MNDPNINIRCDPNETILMSTTSKDPQTLIDWSEQVKDLLTKDKEARYFIGQFNTQHGPRYILCRHATHKDKTERIIHWDRKMITISTHQMLSHEKRILNNLTKVQELNL